MCFDIPCIKLDLFFHQPLFAMLWVNKFSALRRLKDVGGCQVIFHSGALLQLR